MLSTTRRLSRLIAGTVLAADGVRELLAFDPGKSVILSEVGAVEGNHAVPSEIGLPASTAMVDCYLPWQDHWTTVPVTGGEVRLPDFTRSLVVKSVR